MPTMKPNAWGLLTEEQAKAALTGLERSLEQDQRDLDDDRTLMSLDDVAVTADRIDRGREAYELLAAELYPQHAEPHVRFQLQQAGILPTDETTN